jgi:hypothetical protein
LLQEIPFVESRNTTKQQPAKMLPFQFYPRWYFSRVSKNTDEFVYLIASKDFRGVGVSTKTFNR